MTLSLLHYKSLGYDEEFGIDNYFLRKATGIKKVKELEGVKFQLNLLNDLKAQFGFTYIFISHDLAVVKYMADQLLVMNKGKIEEIGDADKGS